MIVKCDWADRFSITVTDERHVKTCRHYAAADPPSGHTNIGGPLGLEKGRLVLGARKAVLAACSSMGIERKVIPTNRIHLVDAEEWPWPKLAGREFLSHVFLRRERSDLLHDALHEFSHGVSYRSIVAITRVIEEQRFPLVFENRSGLVITQCRNGIMSRTFQSLNEAVTDLLANRAAHILYREKICGIETDTASEAIIAYGYPYPILAAIACCHFLANDFGGFDQALRRLLTDYLSGSNDFLRALNRSGNKFVRFLAVRELDKIQTNTLIHHMGGNELRNKSEWTMYQLFS